MMIADLIDRNAKLSNIMSRIRTQSILEEVQRRQALDDMIKPPPAILDMVESQRLWRAEIEKFAEPTRRALEQMQCATEPFRNLHKDLGKTYVTDSSKADEDCSSVRKAIP